VFVACHQTGPKPHLWQDSDVGRWRWRGSWQRVVIFASQSKHPAAGFWQLALKLLKAKASHFRIYCKLGKPQLAHSFCIQASLTFCISINANSEQTDLKDCSPLARTTALRPSAREETIFLK